MTAKLPPVHPGEVLLEEFLEPTGLSQYRLAKDISVPPRRINEIVRGKRAITADTALRLARYFGTTPRFWLNLQAQYELDIETDRLGDRLDREVAAHASWTPRATTVMLCGLAVGPGRTQLLRHPASRRLW
jgi:addiction module HigA family antidote